MPASSDPNGASPPGGCAPRPEGLPDTLIVLVVVAHEQRRQWLRTLLAAIDPHCHVEAPTSAVKAISQLARGPAQLVIVDLAADGGQPYGLIHLLARTAPDAVIAAFAEVPAQHPSPPRQVRPWQDAPAVLRHAIQAIRRQQPPPRPVARQDTDR